jgi:valyl-tRNA synthetase
MSAQSLPTRFVPADHEPAVLEAWLSSGLFHPDPEGTAAENYSIAIPPPNVTGSLHMGHALNGTIQDVLIRHHRMLGRRVKWILGTDHAGIATQKQVEKAVTQEGGSREQMGRDAFVERVWQWREQYGSTIIGQFQRIGASCDYSQERFTLDQGYERAVLEVFVRLYEKGFIYRDNYMVNWDPGSRSAISDLEVEEREVVDRMVEIAYPLADGSGELIVATVRPETMLADVAVAVHPEDERYRHLIGTEVKLPLTERTIPVIADEYVKLDFGTGALKITPGHDPNDFEIGRRHGLPEPGVIGEDGRMTSDAGPYAGLTAAQARDRVIADLEGLGLLRGVREYTHVVPHSHRSGERIEPLISLQWFMRMDELAAPAIKVVEEDQVRFHPDRWKRVYLNWMENIRPWCVSRQLWWGHRLPVWYRGEEIHVGMQAPEGDGWTRDEDVLDTWFSSALWPFATLGWPDSTDELKAFYPTDVLSTARDILFLWVARMIMMGLEFTGDIPFSDVYVHSVIQAPDGRRMSKSLGTGIDPVQEIDAHGADGVRFGLLAMSSTQDVRYSAEKVQQGQQLANKLWNAARFALTLIPEDTVAEARPTRVEDRWILSRLEAARSDIRRRIEEFDLSHAALLLYDFVYGELCDWYIEIVKPRFSAGGDELADLASTLLFVVEETLALAHPVIPFVTESLWPHLPGTDGLLASRGAPQVAPDRRDAEAEASIGALIEAVQAVRGWRDAASAPAGAKLRARLASPMLEPLSAELSALARLDFESDDAEVIATVPAGDGTIEILESGVIDTEAAAKRLAKQRAEIESALARTLAKLSNDGFLAKAPDDVVAAEREKADRLQRELDSL